MTKNILSRKLPVTDSSPLVWIGNVSFEARCFGSAYTLVKNGAEIEVAAAFEYPTKLSPRDEGEQLRALNRRNLEKLLGSRVQFPPVHPYRYAEFIGILQALTEKLDPDQRRTIVFDVTCLTKVHTFALAWWLVNCLGDRTIFFAYSQPERYGNPARNIWGKGRWLKTILLPLDLESNLSFSSTSVVAMLGHEGDRMRLAINEADPERGLVIKASPEGPGAEQLVTVTDIQNSWLRRDVENGMRVGFSEINIALDDLRQVYNSVSDFCENSRKLRSRVVLCPFGPKPFALYSGISALRVYPEGAWLAYPIPAAYDVHYSQGYSHTLWFEISLPVTV